ncbi:exodeoxyribonuclease VII small subunit [Falsiporphyromonas endometrii]|uniref:Exodeoxyribonuclease VII small subunit n=1 Tax=Falsiporphyromonas endometrii TaxID=1387297 RepID=A0ABV9KAA1_9PORP|nr:exodeoxyribonuclease VII small subunit [Porphyromonadaceae bacterium]
MKSDEIKKMTYSQAMERLEEIIQKIEHESPDVDELTKLVAEAVELVKFSKEKLTTADKKLEELIAKLD